MATTEQIDAWQAQLAEAQDAYHRLMIGESEVTIQQKDGRKVQYKEASSGKLLAYINHLKALIAGRTRSGKGAIRYLKPV